MASRLLFLFAALFISRPAASAAPAGREIPVDDQYVLGPDSQPQPGVPEGKLAEFTLPGSKAYPGFARKWWLYLPAGYDGHSALPLMVWQDGGRFSDRTGAWRVPVVLDNLIAKKQIPAMAAIFIDPGDQPEKLGQRPAKRTDGRNVAPANRATEYDVPSAAYVNFLVDEILPLAREHMTITDDPAGRGIGGSSSGGICAFTAAWERPDQFRKVYTANGSFVNLRGGHLYPGVVRAAGAKPIRVFQQDGRNDMTGGPAGSWPEGNQTLAAALDEKGYDHQFVFGEGTHNPKHGASILPYALRWLWRDYPITPAPGH
ncbi:MAG: Esterase [Lacunisphaera sp.]|nr:Esterase [Lacunisphaera sp.]